MASVAQALRLSRQTARRYERAFLAHGKSGLVHLGDVGRRPVLGSGAMNSIIAIIKHSPTLHGYYGPLWRREDIQELIASRYGIRYSRSHLNRLIRDYGLQDRFRPR